MIIKQWPQVIANNVEVLPLQDDNNLLLLAEQPHLIQEPPPANQLNNQGIDPNDGNDDVEQVEDVPIGVPFLMNIDPPQIMMMEESPILPFQHQLLEVANYVVISNRSILLKLCTLQGYWISPS